MKNLRKIYLGLLAGIGVLITSCEVNEITEVREITNTVEAEPNIIFEDKINFTEGNEFKQVVSLPNNLEIRDNDLVIAYLLNGRDDANNPIWEALPTTINRDEGQISFTFNYSLGGIQVVLEGESGLNISTLPEDVRLDRIFQFAVIPGRINSSGKILNSEFTYEKVSANAKFVE